MNTPSDPPRRRWPRFSLRTFLVLFTALAVWIGWNANQVPQRRQVEQYVLTVAATTKNNPRSVITYGDPIKPWKSMPIIWRLLGAQSVRSIDLTHVTLTEEDRKHIPAWFPEADVFF